MTAAGWLTRFRPRLSRGKHEFIYQLDRKGFDLAKASWGLDGPYIEEEAKWRTRHVREYNVVEHDLQVNAWVFAYRALVGENLIDWRGPDQGRIDVPTTYDRDKRKFRPVDDQDVNFAIDDYHHPTELRLDHYRPLFPDATLTLYRDAIGAEVDLLIELDRTRRPTKNVDKLRRYDAFLTAWWRVTDRYRHAKEFPWVIFVCPGEAEAHSLMQVADREVTGQYSGYGPRDWPHPGRQHMLFVDEEDIHDGLPLAWSLPRHPAGKRDTDDFWSVDAELPLGRLTLSHTTLLPGRRGVSSFHGFVTPVGHSCLLLRQTPETKTLRARSPVAKGSQPPYPATR